MEYSNMNYFRSNASYQAYAKYKENNPSFKDTCPLCSKPSLKEFTYWKIVVNDFPYDAIAAIHHMVIPKIHIKEEGLTFEMYQELVQLKNTYLNDHYNHIIEPLPENKSIPEHFHLHVVQVKELPLR